MRALNGATDGRGSVILVGGARGIGKTTQCLRILVEGEGDAGGSFEFVVPQFAPDEPYTPFIKLLWEVGERDPALGHIVADAAPRWASPDGRLGVEDVRLHDDFAHAMAALAAKRRPFVVAVDDVGDLDLSRSRCCITSPTARPGTATCSQSPETRTGTAEDAARTTW